MKVAWLADEAQYIGGAELTQAEFAAAAPDGIEIERFTAHDWRRIAGCDLACVFNSVTFPPHVIHELETLPVIRYWNDLAPHGDPDLRGWLVRNAHNVFCSPLHQAHFERAWGDTGRWSLIPPPVDLARFTVAADNAGERHGAVSVAAWQNPGKAPERVAEWGMNNGGVRFFGGGPFAPPESVEVAQDDLPELLATFERFVFLPTALEPFGRAVAEAWAAGCELVVNGRIGARHWIETDPDAITTAAADFWTLVTGDRTVTA